jgi:hypothetical protein
MLQNLAVSCSFSVRFDCNSDALNEVSSCVETRYEAIVALQSLAALQTPQSTANCPSDADNGQPSGWARLLTHPSGAPAAYGSGAGSSPPTGVVAQIIKTCRSGMSSA